MCRRGAEEAFRTRVWSAWGKFNELAPVLAKRGVSSKLKGKICDACAQRVLVYGSEMWAMKAEDIECVEDKIQESKVEMVWAC